jgi:hypothetical protein
MEAQIWPERIDIFNAPLPKQIWDKLLGDLKAEHVPVFTPASILVGSVGPICASIYRTAAMSNEQIADILEKYGIRASLQSSQHR